MVIPLGSNPKPIEVIATDFCTWNGIYEVAELAKIVVIL